LQGHRERATREGVETARGGIEIATCEGVEITCGGVGRELLVGV
jgi:hypothetical protein